MTIKKYTMIFILLITNIFMVKAQHPPVFDGMTTDSTKIMLGDLELDLVRYSYQTPGINFLAIHDNEDTGVKAAFDYIAMNGGSILDCQYGGARNFKFTEDEITYQTDPNSIYTDEGLPLGLAKYGASSEPVIAELKNTGKIIMKTYNQNRPGYIFTLHNNADGGFGIQSYLPENELGSTADSVHVNYEMDEDDMILVTELKLFNLLKKEDVNVVLQSQEAVDDGSLSIYAMQNKIPYINVEVQHGHQDENLRLIQMGVKAMAEAHPEKGIKKPAESTAGF
ncbi:hypothetical protein [Pedobacter lusitanus]|nr:hypothetical protein [Pedobacter lusitanus]